MTVLDNKGFH